MSSTFVPSLSRSSVAMSEDEMKEIFLKVSNKFKNLILKPKDNDEEDNKGTRKQQEELAEGLMDNLKKIRENVYARSKWDEFALEGISI